MLIYKATLLSTGKSYIGLTSKTLGERRSRHYIDARANPESQFYAALLKYDRDDWNWEILAECESFQEANDLEIQMIFEHDTYKNGYNSTTGGYETHWPDKRSMDDIPTIKLSGINISQEKRRSRSYRQNMSKSKKAFYESEAGETLKQTKSEKMKAFWATPEGQARKELLRKKCGRPQSEESKQASRERTKRMWEEGGSKSFNR